MSQYKKILISMLLITSFVNGSDLVWLDESPKRLNWNNAVKYCKDRDAKLPSREQFKKLWLKHNQSSNISGFELSVSYWTSTELKDNKLAAYPFYFGFGKDSWYYKKDKYGVRCIK